jgi:hypothetical protein
MAMLIFIASSTASLAAEPGTSYPASAEVSDQKAGSVLVYNFYSSDAIGGVNNNTKFSITNTSATLPVTVHLFFVSEGCSVADYNVCLSPNFTGAYLVSELDPGITGYLVAIAIDSATGWPISHNFLIGDAKIKYPSGQNILSANLPAEAFAAVFTGIMPVFNPSSTTAVLNFSGTTTGYNRVPTTLALSNIPSRADQNETTLILIRFGGNLMEAADTLPRIFGLLYNDQETSFSFTITSGTCQKRLVLSDQEPRTVPRFTTIIPAGRSGWMKLYTLSGNVGILGSMINFNPNAATRADVFNGGHNLHKLTFSSTPVSLTIPVFPASCR